MTDEQTYWIAYWRRRQALGTVPDFQALMALVGNLLLRWGWLEDSLAGKPVPSELDHVRRIRNALCHRMISARADPEGERVAHVSCRLLDGTIVRFSAGDLEAAVRDLELARRTAGSER